VRKPSLDVFTEHYRLLDSRLTNPRYPNYAYRAPAPGTRREWEERKRLIRRRILVSAGLLPAPARTPLVARVFDRKVLDRYSVEKVSFESRPRFLVTGNLYRPLGVAGRRPAVLCPHGHWPNGRLEDSEDCSVVARCAGLARLGFVVFSYDMIGYNDSCQIRHRWDSTESLAAMLHGIGPFGLQLWNSIRALDFLETLEDVDPARIGCTGASGGATQTYYLAAVDERVRVVVPVCMASAHYQGGCLCEEPPLVHLGDVTTLDVVGSLAPRPVLLPSVTQDWTNQNPTYDVPALRRIWSLYGAADRLENVHFDAPHNYNRATREHVYAWFRRWLAGQASTGRRIREERVPLPAPADMRLFPSQRPPAGLPRGRALLEELMRQEDAAFSRPPASRAELHRLERTWGPIYAEVIDAAEPTEPVSLGPTREILRDAEMSISVRMLGRYGRGEQTPGLWIVPRGAGRKSPAALVLHGRGKQALFRGRRPGPLLEALLDAGVRVLAVDMLGKGETASLLECEPLERNDPIFYAFNRSLTAHRVQEALTSLAALRREEKARRPTIIGVGIGGVVALLARVAAGPLNATLVDLEGLAVEDDRFWLGEPFHPLVRKIGDLRGAIALGPASPLVLARATPGLRGWVRTIYHLRGCPSRLSVLRGALEGRDCARWTRAYPR